jgi:Na+-translocating ferredoxin:NAD+ oxidoreductase RNF subunit RnfB
MAIEARDTEKLRKLVKLLPGENCGKCGYENCGKYAVALVEDNISPLTCRKSLGNIKEICEVLGVPVPENAAQIAEERWRRHAHRPHGHHGPHHGRGLRRGLRHHRMH